MSRRCTVCDHAARDEIDAALIRCEPIREIAKRFADLSPSGIYRHGRNHLPAHLARAAEVREAVRADDLLAQVESLRDSAITIMDQAEGDEDWGIALRALREARACIELLARVAGELSEGVTVNVAVDARWVEIRQAVVASLAPFPEARAAVVSAIAELEAAP